MCVGGVRMLLAVHMYWRSHTSSFLFAHTFTKHPQVQEAAQQAAMFVVQQEQRVALLHSLRLLLAAGEPRRAPATTTFQLHADVVRACGDLVQHTVTDALPVSQNTTHPPTPNPTPATVRASAVQVAAAAVALTMDVVNAWGQQCAAAQVREPAPRGRGLSRLGGAGGKEGPALGNGGPEGSRGEGVEVELLGVIGRIAARWLRACEDTVDDDGGGVENGHRDVDVVMTDEDTPTAGGPPTNTPQLSAHDTVTHRLLTSTLLLATACMQHDSSYAPGLPTVWGALLGPLCRLADRPTTPPQTALLALRLLSMAIGPQGISQGEYLPVVEAQLGVVSMLARLLRAAQDNMGDAPGMLLGGVLLLFFSTTQHTTLVALSHPYVQPQLPWRPCCSFVHVSQQPQRVLPLYIDRASWMHWPPSPGPSYTRACCHGPHCLCAHH